MTTATRTNATRPRRPTALPVRFDGIPAELRAKDRWVVWRYESRDGKWTKPPFTAAGEYADSTVPATWTTFEKAKAAYLRGGWDGVGLIHLEEDGLTGLDWDKCRCPESGVIEAGPAGEIRRLDTYTEVSPSATGVRAYARGKKPGRRCKDGHFEMYDGLTAEGKQGGRFLTVTGHRLDKAPETINERQQVIDELYRERLDPPKGQHKQNGTAGGKAGPTVRMAWSIPDGPLSDEDVLKLVEVGADAKLTALWNGSVSGHDDDDSRADAALLEKIAWWIGGIDEARLDRLFRQSKLYRPKWDRENYRRHTFDFLAGVMTSFRRPKDADGGGAPEFAYGAVTLRPLAPRVTAGGKLVVPVTVSRGGRPVDQITVTNSTSGRRDAAKLLAVHLGDAGKAAEAVAKVLEWAVGRAGRPPAAAPGPTLADVVREQVPSALKLAYRTDRGGIWSEQLGREVPRTEFVAYTPSWLLDAAAGAADVPRSQSGEVDRRGLIRAVGTELEVLWCDQTAKLPRAADADLGRDTAAGRKFREALIRLWTSAKTFEVTRSEGESVASRATLVSRVLSALQAPPVVGRTRPGWNEVQRSFDAWWRPGEDGKGECVTFLAMRWTLAGQIGVELPGVFDQASLTRLGDQYGVFAVPEGVTDRLSGGVRLAVLSLDLTAELLARPLESAPGDTVTADEPSPEDSSS